MSKMSKAAAFRSINRKLLNETMKMSKSVKRAASFSDGKSIIEKMKVGVELDPLLGI